MATINLILDQATTFNASIQLVDSSNNAIDLTNYTGISDIRRSYNSVNVTASFVVTLSGNTGYVNLGMDANTSALVPYGRYDYDVLLTSNTGDVSKVVSGKLLVNPTVTIANTSEGAGDI